MGKQADIRRFRRYLRDRVARGVTHPDAAESAYRRAKGRQSLGQLRAERVEPRPSGETVVVLDSEASRGLFRVGMSIKGPPELFGLPPDPPGQPPSEPCTVTAVDYETGTITLDSAAPQTRPAIEWPAPGMYDANELVKRRYPL